MSKASASGTVPVEGSRFANFAFGRVLSDSSSDSVVFRAKYKRAVEAADDVETGALTKCLIGRL